MGEDQVDFEGWYRREQPRMVVALTLAAGSRDVAEEVVAEALSRLLDRWDGPRRPADPSAWTYTVAVNLLRRRWRRRQREALTVVHLAPPALVALAEPEVELWRAVAGLAPRARLAVVLRYLGGMTEPEVAEAMGVAVGTVAATLTKARAALGRELHEPTTASTPDPRRATDG